MCFFCGGIKYSQQRFSTLANKVAASLLFMSCIALIIPSTAGLIYGAEVVTPSVITKLSHAISIVLILLYGGYLLFQLKTHRDLFTGEESEEEPALSLVAAVGTLLGITVLVAVCSGELPRATGGREEAGIEAGRAEGGPGARDAREPPATPPPFAPACRVPHRRH